MLQPVPADQLCRACATLIANYRQEEASRQFQKFRHLYSTLSNLKVYDDDDLPKLLCTACADLLEKIENFKESCTRSIDSIRKLILANLKEEPIDEIVSAETLEPILKVENEDVKEQKFTKKVAVAKITKVKTVAKCPDGDRPMCDLCGNSFVNMKGIRKHMNLELKKRSEVVQILNCSYGCRLTFVNPKSLMTHLKKHADREVSYFCSPCNIQLANKRNYQKHMSIHHKKPKISSHTCPTCDVSFNTAKKLKVHFLIRHPGEEKKEFACKKCGVGFMFENELELHKNSFHKAFICHHCGKAWYSKTNILKHLISKHTVRGYETCTICGMKLLQVNSLRHYVKKHTVLTTTAANFQCKICGKEFYGSYLLNRHLKIHSGLRPHVCDQCGKSFLRWNCLKKHFLSHSGQRPMHCAHCGKGVHNKHALNIHMNIHKREWIAQGQTGIELMVYATSNKSKNSNEKKYANLNQKLKTCDENETC